MCLRSCSQPAFLILVWLTEGRDAGEESIQMLRATEYIRLVRYGHETITEIGRIHTWCLISFRWRTSWTSRASEQDKSRSSLLQDVLRAEREWRSLLRMEGALCCWKKHPEQEWEDHTLFLSWNPQCFQEHRFVLSVLCCSICPLCFHPVMNITLDKLRRRIPAISLQPKPTRALRFRAFQEDRQYNIRVILFIPRENVKDTGSWRGMSKKTNLDGGVSLKKIETTDIVSRK